MSCFTSPWNLPRRKPSTNTFFTIPKVSPPFLSAAAPSPVSRLVAGFYAPCHNSTDHIVLLLLVGLSGFLARLKPGDDRNHI